MKPLQDMKPVIPGIIQEECNELVEIFSIEILDELPQKLSQNKTWKELEEVLVEITKGILNTLGNVWRNPAFCPKFENAQSEGIYVTDVVVPLLQATLKELPVRKITLLSTAERQSVVSADRKGDGKQVCTKIKEENDDAKLWREMNDGMTWVHKGCKPDKNEFGILGIHIAGKIMHLNVLIKDTDEIVNISMLLNAPKTKSE
ncbi:5857_t:CDS:2 [Racocetra persica]|uniref:5857_t:CDS:1 n=1 Tax=Racocetra persica TaxID=160502 RepID=A0ACA9RH33_9GLOM|nr:5857_t:CDS:2 [Racocetra persica]